jgi:peptide/nickel transport system substrate-binding protein
MKKLFLTLPVLAILLPLTFSCSKGAKKKNYVDNIPLPKDVKVFKTRGQRGGSLVLTLPSNPKTFNPLLASSVDDVAIVYQLYSGLATYNYVNADWELDLAKSITSSKDNLRYTIKVREGLKWSDGKPFSLEDILFSYKVLTDPNVNAGAKDTIRQADASFPTLEKIDEETLRFTLKGINPLFETILWDIKILPKHIWESDYSAGNFMKTMTVGTDPSKMVVLGPYMIDKFVADQRLVLKRNPYFYGVDQDGVRLPYYDKIIRVIVPDMNAMSLKFQNGEIDMMEVRPEDYDLLKKGEEANGYKLHDLGPGYSTYYIAVNQNLGTNKAGKPYLSPEKKKLFTDKRFRQAISYALDRQGIVSNAFHGRATPVSSSMSPANKKWASPSPKPYTYNLKKANALLDAVGIVDLDGDGIREYENGLPVNFSIKTNVENNTRVQIGNMLKQDFRKIGLDTTLSPVPFNSLISSIKESRDYDAYILGWGSAVPPDPIMGKNIYLSTGRSHYWNLQSTEVSSWEKEMDRLVMLNQNTTNLRQRQNYWRQYLKIWEEELPQIMIVAPNKYVGIKKKIGNAKPVSLNPYFQWNIEELFDKSL